MPTVQCVIDVTDDAGNQVSETFSHSVPAAVFASSPSPEQYRGLLGILVSAHTQDMLNAAPFKCITCGDKAKELKQQPVSYLHFEVPTVVDFAQPLCGKYSCDIKASQERCKMLSEVEESQGFNLVDRESYFCRNCRKRDNLQFCARCTVTAYCSKTCQKAHWPVHKKSCVRGHGMP